MRKIQQLSSILLSVIFLLNGCVPHLVKIENTPVLTEHEEINNPTEVLPSLPLSTQTSVPQEATEITAGPTIQPTLPEYREFTYFLDAEKIATYCIEIPQKYILTPLYLGDYYMAQVLEQKSLYSISAEDATINPLHQTEFPNGHPAGGVEIAYPWYTYIISETPSGVGGWNLHLVNVEDGSNTVVANDDQFDSAFLLHISYSLQPDTLYLSASTFDEYEILSSRVYAIDLVTKDATVIIDSQDKDTFMSLISASNGFIVIENDPPQNEYARYLSLFDLSTNSWVDLPQTYPASVPDMEYPYIIWKNNKRFDDATSLTIYNFETGESVVRELAGANSSDPSISNGYIIAEASTGKDNFRNSVVLYSLENGDTYAIHIGIHQVGMDNAYIDNGNVIWAFTTLASADNYSSYICNLPLEEVFSNAVEGIESSQ